MTSTAQEKAQPLQSTAKPVPLMQVFPDPPLQPEASSRKTKAEIKALAQEAESKGRILLEKMGYRSGEALGVGDGEGRLVEPIELKVKVGT